jgi:hypothetical protein
MRCRDDRAPEEIGQGPFSTGSSDEPVLKVQLWPTKTLSYRFLVSTGTKGPHRTGTDIARPAGQMNRY